MYEHPLTLFEASLSAQPTQRKKKTKVRTQYNKSTYIDYVSCGKVLNNATRIVLKTDVIQSTAIDWANSHGHDIQSSNYPSR